MVGTILFDPNFRFHDGKRGEKLFIVLNDGREGSYICVKTTSNGTRYGIVYGCQSFARFPHFFLPKGSCCLQDDTWLCLDEFYEFATDALHDKITRDLIRRVGVLAPTITREIQACAISCDDIAEGHAESIRTIWNETKPE